MNRDYPVNNKEDFVIELPVQREQQVERKGVLLTNYIMEKRV